MNCLQVVDNFFPEAMHKDMVEFFTYETFPWYYQKSTVKKVYDIDKGREPMTFLGNNFTVQPGVGVPCPGAQFMHTLKYWFINHTEIKDCNTARVKANLHMQTDTPKYDFVHKDSPSCTDKSLLYYVMGEGSTEFFESEEDIGTDKALIIKAKPGRAVIFPSNMLHRGVTSTNGDRIAINCVFSEKK